MRPRRPAFLFLIRSTVWQSYRKVALASSALIVRGTLESVSGAINLVADKLTPLKIATRSPSRDFR